MSTKNEQPKTEKRSTSTSQQQLVMAPTSTHSTEIATALPTTAPTTLDACPDEILINIAEFTGAHSCYLGYGAVSKRINQLFNTYSNKLSKSTSYGGYTPFQEIVEKCEKELEKEKEYVYWEIPHIYRKLASGAVTFNRIELLHWAIKKQNEFMFREICGRALRDKKLSIFKQVWNSITNENVMTYMKEETDFICIAAEKGNLDWLMYLHEELDCEGEEGGDYFSGACTSAAKNGHLDCLVYLHENGFEWNYWMELQIFSLDCYEAAYDGHLDCLVYLNDHGCEWDNMTFSSAASGGQLECLKYLHKHGCPWDNYACDLAASAGHLDCLEYMRDNGLEWNHYDEYLGNKAKGSDP